MIAVGLEFLDLLSYLLYGTHLSEAQLFTKGATNTTENVREVQKPEDQEGTCFLLSPSMCVFLGIPG